MGQKVHPKGFRLGVFIDWDARWFARGKSYGDKVLEDLKIRNYLKRALEDAELSRVEIERAGESVKVILHSALPGVIIGKKGQDIESLKRDLSSLLNVKNIEISVQEVKNPELNATLVAKSIAAQLSRRGNYKMAMKKASNMALRGGAKGIKIRCAGRLNGAEIAREEWSRMGALPLHTLRSDIDYGFAEAKTTYGIIGVKVWICRGEYQHNS